MQIVIDIPEGMYKNMQRRANEIQAEGYTLENAVLNGTPLPKGHGDLKDADAMINKLCTNEASDLFGSITCAEIMDFINNEKPIIEADKEDKE